MQEITDKTFTRRNKRGFLEILIFSITTPGWKEMHKFREVGPELTIGQSACPQYGCKVYKYEHDDTHAIMHNNSYGCPKALKTGQEIR